MKETQTTFSPIYHLSTSEVDHLCFAIKAALGVLVNNKVEYTEEAILDKLRSCLRMYGSGYPYEFYVDKVVWGLTWASL